ncbi:uncharacterized protein B0T15DRAFT_297522 [Chaetomium strumarium]|uniref:Uncharacterized protein n=1 Tax=Chaetomium strumarium TaxID=1170767 RepID=A0AAJ0GLN4_9PEZI|nr:hypothetical protein B0T15DRAFT_297522 [Chaetomium strumarium]
MKTAVSHVEPFSRLSLAHVRQVNGPASLYEAVQHSGEECQELVSQKNCSRPDSSRRWSMVEWLVCLLVLVFGTSVGSEWCPRGTSPLPQQQPGHLATAGKGQVTVLVILSAGVTVREPVRPTLWFAPPPPNRPENKFVEAKRENIPSMSISRVPSSPDRYMD